MIDFEFFDDFDFFDISILGGLSEEMAEERQKRKQIEEDWISDQESESDY